VVDPDTLQDLPLGEEGLVLIGGTQVMLGYLNDPERTAKAIVEEAGAKWENVVDVTVFLTNMRADFAIFNRVYAEHFGQTRPCRTTVEVGALPTPIAVELKCIAVMD
jgi:acyl-CoA synthetase (AMP-forming)/AMP-acid ligase II